MRPAVLTTLLLSALSAPVSADPRLVRDLNQGTATDVGGISLYSFTAKGQDGIIYFAATDPAHGRELWRSDGTEAGTYRLTDVCPGRCDSDPGAIELSRGRLFFTADDGVSGRELWRSLDVPGSERRVRDICPGPCSGNPGGMEELGGALFFVAGEGTQRQLWRTTGSRESTVPVATLCTVPPYLGDCVSHLQRVGDLLLFTVDRPNGRDLWRTDGTPAGTVPVAVEDLQYVGSLMPGAGIAYFRIGHDFWRTDGTSAGTFRLKSVMELGANPSHFIYDWSHLWNGMLIMGLGKVLARSDGTPEGTVPFYELPLHSEVTGMVPTPAGLLLVVSLHSSATSLWITRGTAETTGKLLDFGYEPGATDGIVDIAPLGDVAVFRVIRPGRGALELWVTDGTMEGTRHLEGVSVGTYPWEFVSAGSQVFFVHGSYERALDLWRTDGTPAGTRRVHDFGDVPASSGPLAQTAFQGRLLFSARTADGKAPLFRSDGTRAGTRLLSDEAEAARGFTQVGDLLFFGAAHGLWRTDGTPAGTVRISEDVYGFRSPVPFRGQLFFGGADAIPHWGNLDVELWRSDGRSTRLVKDINPFAIETGFHHACEPAASDPGPAIALGNRLVFAATHGITGRELWVSNGTRTGTRLVLDINPSRSPEQPAPDCDNRQTTGLSSNPDGFVRLGEKALFAADDGKSGRELWRTDGTPEGTRRVADLRRGPEDSSPHDLVRFRGAVYFIAATAGAGEALWRTDGSARGTVVVDNLRVGTAPSWARSLTVVGDRLFFLVYNETTGPELWVSGGDGASTGLVTDLRPGAPGSYPQALADAGGVLVFAADDGQTGLEPWRSDGTATGTVRLGDVNPGRDASSPGPFTRAGNFVFTGAWDPVHGRELRVIPLEEVLEGRE